MKRNTLIAFVFVLFLFPLYGEDDEKLLLDLYMSPGVTLSRAPIFRDQPSEHATAVAAAKRIRRDLDIMVRMNFDNYPNEILNKFKLGRMGKPIAIRQFDNHNDGNLTQIYAFYVPFLYKKEYIGHVSYTWDIPEKSFNTGVLRQYPAKDHMIYLLDEKDVTALLEKITETKFKQVPFAVSFPYPRFGMTPEVFFWYTYNDQGIEKNGKVYHSFFVYPFVKSADADKVTFEEIMAPRDKSLIKSRIYVLAEDDMNLYEVDRKEKTGEMSFDQEAFRRSREHKKQYGTYDREVPPFDLKLVPFTP